MMTNLALLRKPFTNIKWRKGSDGKQVAYVTYHDVQERVIDATDGQYDWSITEIRFIEGQPRLDRETGDTYMTPGVWMVTGKLTLPGLGTRDGVGTAQAHNEDAVKSAETDAFKRAAVKFGVGLHLYKKETPPPVATVASADTTPAPVVRTRPGACTHCIASNPNPGNHHKPGCPNRTEERAARR